MEAAERCRCGFLDGVGHRDQPGEPAVHGDMHYRAALLLQCLGPVVEGRQIHDALLGEPSPLANQNVPALHAPAGATARHGVEVHHRRHREVPRRSTRHDRPGQWVFTVLFDARGSLQQIGLGHGRDRNALSQRRATRCQCAGLVDDYRVDLFKSLEHLGVLDEHSFPRPTADADHDRHRRRQT